VAIDGSHLPIGERPTTSLVKAQLLRYDVAIVAIRILRLVAVASILALGLTARTASVTYANADQPAELPPVLVEPPPTPAEPLPPSQPLDPAPADAPTPAPVPDAAEVPISDPIMPGTTELPSADPAPIDPPSSDPPVTVEPSPTEGAQPPSDAATGPPTPDPTDGPVVEALPLSEVPVVADPSSEGAPATAPSAVPAPLARHALGAENPLTAPKPANVNPAAPTWNVGPAVIAAAWPGLVAAAPSIVPATLSSPVAGNGAGMSAVGAPAPAAEAKAVVAGVRSQMAGVVLIDELEPVSAGLVVGLAATQRVPTSVAVAVEFGRAGGGWAGAVVFNLWLRRQLRERRMTQRQLAALSGVHHSTISRLMRDDRSPSLATATKLAKALRQVQGESDTADYFDRIPVEAFPARRVEMALRADELLTDDEILSLMRIYLHTRRRRLPVSSAERPLAIDTSAPAGADPIPLGPNPRR